MKKTITFATLFSFALLIFVGCGETKKDTMDVKDYNDKLVAIQTSVVKSFLALTDAFSTGDKTKIDAAYAAALKATVDAVEAIKKEGPFEGDDTMRQKLQTLLEFYKSLAENEFKEMITIMAKYPNITPEEQNKLVEINNSITEREKKLDADFQVAHDAFAEKFGLRVVDNELQKEVDKMNEHK